MTENSYTPFGPLKVAQQEVQYALNPDDGLTRKRYGWKSNGSLFDSTLFTEEPGQLEITTRSSEANDSAMIRPAYAGQYVAQSVGQPGHAVQIDDANLEYDKDGYVSLTHGRVAFGPYWERGGVIVSGWGIEIDSEGARVFRISDGVHQGDSPIPQSEWNMDTFSGKGGDENPSGNSLRIGDSLVFNYPYTWYNSNRLSIGMIDKHGHPKREGESVSFMHKFQPETAPSVDKPNVSPTLIVENNGTADTLKVGLGGAQYSTYGGEGGFEVRRTPEWATTSGSTIVDTVNDPIDPAALPGVPLLSVQREAGAYDLEVKLSEIDVTVDQNIRLYFWDIYSESELTGASFSEVSSVNFSKETHLESDVDATALDTTNAVFRGTATAESDGNNKINVTKNTNVDDKIPIDAIRVITAVNTAGSTTDVMPLEAKFTESF
jgi:hypothetical protein